LLLAKKIFLKIIGKIDKNPIIRTFIFVNELILKIDLMINEGLK